MTLKELLTQVGFDELLPHLKRHEPEHLDNLYAFREAYDILRNMEPANNFEGKIFVEWHGGEWEDEEKWIGVGPMHDCTWEEDLAKEIVVADDVHISKIEIAMHCLWEITYWGFSPDEREETWQRKFGPKVLNNKQGSIVSIPTSSGKTRIGEIAILNCLLNEPKAKILFIAPYRSLAYEIENSFDEIFSNLDVSVSHLYGGSLFSKLDERIIDESSVIVATPEKAKALFRSNEDILSCIKLVIIDEGHLLGTDKRLIVNEMFYEELKYHVKANGGRFLLLSAVLPNAEDLSEWLTDSTDNVYKENWRPSDERIGIMEWNGVSVNLNWKSTDAERNSFNPNFIMRQKLPKKPKERIMHYFPENKNQAIASTAYKLRKFGPVLIFVGIKKSVFAIAREYEKCIQPEEQKFRFRNKANWRAFKLACIESYGEDTEWVKFAKQGIFCHNADLISDVRIPLERLMRSEKPRVIIATSTLGQGVNLGVSTVIFSTLYQSGNPITKRDFWNIAGRAGRAFVDHEGKILVAHDITKKDENKINWERKMISAYLNKSNIDRAESGCLELIRTLKTVAQLNGIAFDNLINLLAENRINEIDESLDEVNDLLDLIDDGLLSLHNSNNFEGNTLEWIDSYFTLKSATKLFSVLLASKRPLITELADKLRLKYPLLPTISPCPTMRLEAIRSIIPISCRRYPKSV